MSQSNNLCRLEFILSPSIIPFYLFRNSIIDMPEVKQLYSYDINNDCQDLVVVICTEDNVDTILNHLKADFPDSTIQAYKYPVTEIIL